MSIRNWSPHRFGQQLEGMAETKINADNGEWGLRGLSIMGISNADRKQESYG